MNQIFTTTIYMVNKKIIISSFTEWTIFQSYGVQCGKNKTKKKKHVKFFHFTIIYFSYEM